MEKIYTRKHARTRADGSTSCGVFVIKIQMQQHRFFIFLMPLPLVYFSLSLNFFSSPSSASNFSAAARWCMVYHLTEILRHEIRCTKVCLSADAIVARPPSIFYHSSAEFARFSDSVSTFPLAECS
jgi:hypothetical protein